MGLSRVDAKDHIFEILIGELLMKRNKSNIFMKQMATDDGM